MEDLHDADAIFVATHSQGSVVSTHILDRLISDGHIRTALSADTSVLASGVTSGSVAPVRPPQRICCLALCGIHLGPLRYLSTSSLVQPYIQARRIPLSLCFPTHGNPSISNPRLREKYLNSRFGSFRFRYMYAFSSERVLVVSEHGKRYIPGLRKSSSKCPG